MTARAAAERWPGPPAPPSDFPRPQMALRQARAANPAQTSSADELKQLPPPAPPAQQARRWSERRWNEAPLYPSTRLHQSGTQPPRQSLHQERRTKQSQLESAPERPLQRTPQLPVPAAAHAAKMLPTSAKQFGRSYTRPYATLWPAHSPNSPRLQL